MGESAADPAADPAFDPAEAVEDLLAKADEQRGDKQRATLEKALKALSLAAVPAAPAAAAPSARAEAYRAEILRRLGRREEAARAYAGVVLAVIDNAEAVHRGLQDLLDSLCGYEDVLRILDQVKQRHPGRDWQWIPIGDEASKRRRLEAEAPLDGAGLDRLRREVALRLAKAPCAHDDDRRPVAAESARALGFPEEAVLAWLSGLGACCCDCQVAAVKAPWESRRR